MDQNQETASEPIRLIVAPLVPVLLCINNRFLLIVDWLARDSVGVEERDLPLVLRPAAGLSGPVLLHGPAASLLHGHQHLGESVASPESTWNTKRGDFAFQKVYVSVRDDMFQHLAAQPASGAIVISNVGWTWQCSDLHWK